MEVGTDTYVTVAEADAYFASHPAAALWDALDGDSKEALLVHACRQFQRVMWAGRLVDSEQPLAWPRYLPDPETGYELQEDGGQELKYAQCEQALWLLRLQSDPGLQQRTELQRQGVRSFSIGGFSETYTGGGLPSGLAPEALEWVRQWVLGVAACR